MARTNTTGTTLGGTLALLCCLLATPPNAHAGIWNNAGNTNFTLAVFGDSLAQGLWIGFRRALYQDTRYQILNGTQHSTGLTRPDRYNWEQVLDNFLRRNNVDAAVFSIGLNDIQALYERGARRYHFRSDNWDRVYAQRIGRLMERLRQAGIPTLWMGLPIPRKHDYAEAYAHINSLIRNEAERYGVIYVPLWDLTMDENGQYSSYLRDLRDPSGRLQRMRADDGVHFTWDGYEMLSHYLLSIMRNRFNEGIPQ